MKKLMVVLVLLFLSACNLPQTTPTPESNYTILEVIVTAPQSAGSPLLVQVKGETPDACTVVEYTVGAFQSGSLPITLGTFRTGDVCAQVVSPFELNISAQLPADLPAGTYNVAIAGKSYPFQFTGDVQPTGGEIHGIVFHDLCDSSTTDTRCTDSLKGRVANGSFDPGEEGIGGVQVNLYIGGCSSSTRQTTLSAADGSFAFTGVSGSYCVAIDPLQDPNPAILQGGQFTQPYAAAFADFPTAVHSGTISAGEVLNDVNFGWDYAALPAGSVGLLRGALFHDLCDGSAADTRCVGASDGSYHANGIFEEGEPPIGGAHIVIYAGACPGDPANSSGTETNETDGSFNFYNLQPGEYCLVLDPLYSSNVDILIPGNFTLPYIYDGKAEITVNVPAGEMVVVNLGWDYQFAP